MSDNLFGRFHKSTVDKKGTIKGLHYQIEPYQEIKIVRCVRGAIFDIRVKLDTLKKEFIFLNSPDRYAVIPSDYAHGYQTLEDNCEIEYFITNQYSPENARGLHWNDPKLSIQWPFQNPTVNERDSSWRLL